MPPFQAGEIAAGMVVAGSDQVVRDRHVPQGFVQPVVIGQRNRLQPLQEALGNRYVAHQFVEPLIIGQRQGHEPIQQAVRHGDVPQSGIEFGIGDGHGWRRLTWSYFSNCFAVDPQDRRSVSEPGIRVVDCVPG